MMFQYYFEPDPQNHPACSGSAFAGVKSRKECVSQAHMGQDEHLISSLKDSSQASHDLWGIFNKYFNGLLLLLDTFTPRNFENPYA